MNFPSKPWSDGQTAELIAGSTFVYDSAKEAWLLQISAEQGKINSLEVSVDSDLNVVNTRLTTAEGNITTIQSDIADLLAALDSDYALNNEKHAVQEALITANTNQIDTANARIDVDSDRLVAVDARVTTNEGDIAALDIRVADLEANADSDVIDISRLRREADSDTLVIQTLGTQAAATEAEITKIKADLDSDGVNLQALRTDLEAEIAATDADVTALTARLDSDETVIQDLQTQIDAIGSGNLAEISARLDSDSTAIQSLRTDLNITALAVANADTKIDAVAADLDSEKVVLGRQYIQTTTPANPGPNDMWFDPNTGILFAYDAANSVWVQTL